MIMMTYIFHYACEKIEAWRYFMICLKLSDKRVMGEGGKEAGGVREERAGREG